QIGMDDVWPDVVLARRDQLPLRPTAVELAGELVTLRPVDLDRDLDGLFAVSSGAPVQLGDRCIGAYDAGARLRRYLAMGPFATPAELRVFLARQDDATDGRPFTVRDRANGAPIGVVNLMANAPMHLRIELGHIWYGPIAQRTGASREVTRLLLAHV